MDFILYGSLNYESHFYCLFKIFQLNDLEQRVVLEKKGRAPTLTENRLLKDEKAKVGIVSKLNSCS